MLYFARLGLAGGLGLSVAVIGGGLAQGRAAAAALEGMARQPEAIGRIQTAMILALAFIESLVIFTFVFLFILNGKLPSYTAEDAKQALLNSTMQPGASQVLPGQPGAP